MDLYVIDFETLFDNEYTLKKMTTEAYVRDPRFKVHRMGIKKDDEPARWIPGAQIARYLADINFADAVILCHHTHFDGLILSHHFGVCPRQWLDTLSMARALLQVDVGKSLQKLSELVGLPPKGELNTKGKQSLTESEMEELGNYCCLDVDNCCEIFFRFMEGGFPKEELPIIDLTIRMFTEPVLELDVEGCQKLHDDIIEKLQQKLDERGLVRSDLSSSSKCGKLLEGLGIKVPMKTSAKGNFIPAMAKTDEEFLALLDHPDPLVQAIVELRLECKSTINQTRAQRFADCAKRGAMPVYLAYGAAHTLRWGGGDKMNWQNLPRIRRDAQGEVVAGHLRGFVRAPEEHKLVVLDLKQIELRLLSYLAGEDSVLDMLRAGIDPYTALASSIFGVPLDQVTKQQRHVGKTAELGLGYGMGADRFYKTARAGGAEITPELAERAKRAYRYSHPRVCAHWYEADRILRSLYRGEPLGAWGPIRIVDRRLYLPNGSFLDYSAIACAGNRDGYVINRGRGPRRLWGGTLVENVVQALARLVLAAAMVEIVRKYKSANCA